MHPILLELGPLPLRSYGLMMALGFAAGIFLALVLSRREGRPDEVVLDLSMWIMAGAIAGARLLYVIVQPQDYFEKPWRILFVWEGGLVYYGGLIGAGFTAYFYMRKQKLPPWHFGDILAPGLALGQAFGRVGCWLNGCCYGRESQEHGVIFPSLGDNIPHLPVMLYEAAFVLALAAFLWWLRPRRQYAGQVFWVYVALYSTGRFILEIFRGDAERGTLISSALSPGQWISIAGLISALVFHLRHRKKHEAVP